MKKQHEGQSEHRVFTDHDKGVAYVTEWDFDPEGQPGRMWQPCVGKSTTEVKLGGIGKYLNKLRERGATIVPVN